jgi:hypothetical protein
VRAAPKRKMAVDWEGLTMGGGDISGDRKCVDEGRGGSVAGMDERRFTGRARRRARERKGEESTMA